MVHYPNTRALLPLLPYRVRQIVRHWIVRGIPAGVQAVVEHEQLYQALKSDLSSSTTHTQ